MLADFLGTLRDRRQRPRHICFDVAEQLVFDWVDRSGRWRPLGPARELAPALGHIWPACPLLVGRAEFDQMCRDLGRRGRAIDRIREGLPFAGDEQAFVAVRLAIEGTTIDFFGLADQSPDTPGALINGRSAVVMQDHVASQEQWAAALDAINEARSWWVERRGQPLHARGSPGGKRGPRDPERRKWWLLAQRIGWEAARAEHKKAGGTRAEWIPIWRHK